MAHSASSARTVAARTYGRNPLRSNNVSVIGGIVLLAFLSIVVDPVWAETSVRIPRADCAKLVEHHPAPDVAYRPGVDVRGKPVPPADLPGSDFSAILPDHVAFDVSFNPLRGKTARRFGRSEFVVGRVRVDLRTGQTTFNGEPLTDPEQAELALKCGRALGRR